MSMKLADPASRTIPSRLIAVLILAARLPPICALSAPPRLPLVEPADVGMDAKALAAIDGQVARTLRAGQMPGCVIAIGRHGKIDFFKAYGKRQLEPSPKEVTTDTLFDMASVTKPVATATSIALLVERGKLSYDDPVAKYLPDFAAKGKDKVTIRQLLLHQGGLIPDNSIDDFADGPARAWTRIFALPLQYTPGEDFAYSDVGYMVLGKVVEAASGEKLDRFARENFYAPLGMTETGYLPGEELRRRAAPTERRGDHWMQGEVHDPRAFALGGVAGHAGLFSTAADLAVFAQMLLGRGEYAGVRVLAPSSVRAMTEPWPGPHGWRCLGWDARSTYSSNRGRTMSPRAFGHGGFTGTGLWIDPELDLFVIFLSNRVHPNGKGNVNSLIGRVGTIAADAVTETKPRQVATGIDVLEAEGFAPLRGRRVGLITNQSGLDRRGTRTIDLLHRSEGVHLVAIFSPEHGPRGELERHGIADGRDGPTGLPIYSLYGKTLRPTDAMLRGIDTLVYDIQDVGVRFYTYTTTLGYCMEEAARRGIRFVVLDRPDPIGGLVVEGPMLDAGRESFVAYDRRPVRHGMTVGELAMLYRDERKMHFDLAVVRMEGWRRGDLFDATGLKWTNPSPNIRSLNEALLYPGTGLLEPTNVSVGRGTATPFEVFGAPWLDAAGLQKALAAAKLPGVEFRAADFTPDTSNFSGKECHGIRITITDRAAFDPLPTGLEIARQLAMRQADQWKADAYIGLLGNRKVLEAVRDGKSVEQIEAIYQPELDRFIKQREKYLLYP
jgi:uncharacterized protein YbbC (DUF1343 family)